MSDTAPSIFPCWGLHQRMGHTILYGHFEQGPGDTAICTMPSMAESDDRTGFEAQRHIVPMSGPAFFGFQVLTEDAVMAVIRRRFTWDKVERFRRISANDDFDEAVEVTGEVAAAADAGRYGGDPPF